MKEFKGKVFAISNNRDDDEYGKFIFRWDETKFNITSISDENLYREEDWEQYGLFTYKPNYTRHQEDEWTVITLIEK